MRLYNRTDRSNSRRRQGLRKSRISLEILETRQLLSGSAGFLQGYVLGSVTNPVSVQLWNNTGTTELATTTTNSAGYYNFDAYTNLTAGTTYQITESNPGYTTSVTPSDIQTTINAANVSAVNGNAAIEVTVENLSTQSFMVTNNDLPYNSPTPQLTAYFQLNSDLPYNQPGPFNNTTSNTGDSAGQFDDYLTGNDGTITGTTDNSADNIVSLCTDLFHAIAAPPPPVPFTVQPSLTPASTTQPGLSTNLGEIGYLYNTYGSSIQTNGPSTAATQYSREQINGAGLQLALWALEYNQSPPSGPMTIANPNSPFEVLSKTNSAIIDDANAYLALAYANPAEHAYFLNATKAQSNSTGDQGQICTDLLNFTNSPQVSASVSTAIEDAATNMPPPSGGEALGALVYDTATVTGAPFTPMGTVTYNFYNTASPTYGVTTPISAQTVTLNANGTVPNSTAMGPLMAGSYSYIAYYSGDSHYSSSVGPIEPLTVNQGSSSVSTAIKDSTGGAVTGALGEQVYDTAMVTGTPFTPTGTVTYYFYNTASPVYGTTTPVNSQTVTLSGGVVPASNVTGPLTAGSDAFIGVYSGDSNYTGYVGAVEPLTINQASSSVSTAIYDSTGGAVTGALGESVYDTATVTGTPFTPTGTVTYYFYNTASPVYGTTTPVSSQTVTLSGGVVPASNVTGPLTAGSDAFIGVYSGDSNYTGYVGAVEPLTINQASSSVSTAIYDSTGGAVTDVLGESVYDTATVTGTPFTPTGTVTYYFYNTASPVYGTTTPVSSQTVTLSGGVVPNSNVTGPLTAGSDAFIGVYSGDSNYTGYVGAVEPLTINQASSSVSTAIKDSTGGPVTGALGESVYDTATVTGTPFTPTGTVTYYFYNTASPVYGTTTPVSSQTVTLSSGVVPNSNVTAALTAGSDAFIGVYSGDSNYTGFVGAVEPLTINQASSSVSTAIYDSTGVAVTDVLGESVYDTATVTGTPFTPTGTVTYYFYNTSSPVYGTTTPVSSQTVTLSGGVVPNSNVTAALTAGSDAFIGVYSGDSNYTGYVGAVEPLTINQASSSVSTAIYDSTGVAVTDVLGESVYDTATVTGTPFTPTGTVTYYFYNTASPVYGTTTPVSSQTVTLSGGVVPASNVTGPLTAGSDAFIGVYSGDSNYTGYVGAVEPLTINQASSSVSTAIYDSTGVAVTGALGESVYDTATVTGTPFTPTGTVTYYFYNTASPVYGTTTPVSSQTVTLSGGVVPASNVTGPLTAGSDAFIGVYSGDSNYTGYVGAVEPLTISQASSSVSTAIYDSTGVAVTGALGESVYDTATVTGTPFTPTGTVTYYFYNTASPVYGTTTPVSSQTVTLSGGVVPASNVTGPLTAGSDAFIGVYSGDSNYTGYVGAVEPLTINQASSSVSTAIYDSTGGAVTGALGESVYDTATVTGTPFTPTGTVTYYFYNTSSPVYGTTTPVSSQTVTLSGGVVPNSNVTAALTAGSDAFIGVYSGDSNYTGFVGAVEPLTINQASSSVSTAIKDSTGGPVTGALGEQVYDTATVTGTPFTPTGTVTYYFYNTASPVYGTTTPVSSQTVTLSSGLVPNSATTAALTAGSDAFIGVYSGDSNYKGYVGAVEPLTINQASSSVSTAIKDSTGGAVTGALGEKVYDTATVSGTPFTPTGTVTYYFYNTASPVYGTTTPASSQTVTLSGGVVPASNVTGPLTAGSDAFIGVYSGDSNYTGYVGAVEPLTINQASSSVSTAIKDSTGGPVTSALGEQVYDTATVTGTPFTPTGTVTYYFYNTASPVYGTTTPVSSQTVTLSSGLVPNSATTAALTAGSDAFIGVYSGDSNYKGYVGAVEPLTINQASSSVSTAIKDSTGGAVTGALGEKVYDTATVTGTPFTPTGTVTYYFYNTASPVYGTTTPVSSQTVTLSSGLVPNSATTAALTAGSDAFIGVYSGDSNYKGYVGAVEPLTINQASSSVSTAIKDSTGGAVTDLLGEKVYDTATVTGTPFTPTGTVTYYFYNTASPVYGTTTPVSSQTVTLSGGVVPNSNATAALTAGSDAFIGVYSGDSNYKGYVGAVEPLTINQASSSVSTAIKDSTGGAVTDVLGEKVYDTATVTGTPFTPTGTVTYYFYNTSSPVYGTTTPVSSQTVTLSGGAVPNSNVTAALTAGSDAFIGVYSGDSNYKGYVGAVEPLTINQASSSVSTAIYDSGGGPVTGTAGEKVYDTATVTGTPFTPTGTVTYEFFTTINGTGPYTTQTVTLNANGTVPNSAVSAALSAGSYSYIGIYSGDSNYAGFTGAVEPLTVSGTPNVTVTKTADQSLIAAGQTAGFTVTISNNGTGAANGLTLNDPLPAGAGGDVNWTIDTSVGNPTDFTITGSQASQKLALSSSFIAAGDSLAPGQTIVVHITTPTTVADAGGNTTFAGAAAYWGGAVNYSVLYEGMGGHNLQITNVTTYGNIGVGGTGHVQFNGPGTIGGRLDFSAANTGQYSNNNSSNVGPTSANYNVAAVTTALSTVNGLNSSLAGLGNGLVINGNQTINKSAGQLKTVNGLTYRVFNVTSYNEGNGNVVTINGDGSGNPVVLNFGFNSNVNLGGDVTLSGGLTDDQVLWNFTSSNQNISLNNNASSYPLPLAFHGIILAPNDGISLVNANFDGRVFGGDSSDMQIVSGDHINSPPGTLPNTATVSATGDTGQPGEQATATVTVANVSPCCNLQNVLFTVDNSKGQLVGTFSSLGGNTQQGDTVTVSFTVPTGVYDQLSLVSYVTPQPYYSASSAYLQQVFQSVTQVFGPGTHTIGPVTIPSSYYQIDFVCGTVISQLGLSSTDFYNAQGRMQSSDNGGTTIPLSMAGSTVCAGQTAAPSFWINTAAGKGQALITSLNGGSTATNLGNWLATIAPNLFSSLQGETNTQVASYVKSLGSTSALSQVVATALAAYVTDSSLAGTVATSYGFTVTAYGTGVDNYSVSGSNASALGLSNGTYSIVTLLAAINSESSNGAINSLATTAASTIFGAINTAGKIS